MFWFMVFASVQNLVSAPAHAAHHYRALIRLALGIGLTINETQRLLKVAQRGELYPRNRRDAALIYCIQHQTNVLDAEILLEQIGEKLLG